MHDDLLAEHGIRLARSTLGGHKALCPRCSHTRRHKRDSCLSVRIDSDGIVWCCHNCTWRGGVRPHHRPDRAGGTRWRKARNW